MATPSISFSFSYLESDYVRALRAHYASYLRIWRDLLIIVVSGVGAAYLWRVPSLRWPAVALLCLSVAMAAILVAAFLIIPPWVFRRNPKLKGEFSFNISQEGIRYDTSHIATQLEWPLFTKALVDSYSYLLYWDSRAFIVIPKRVFQTIEQQRAFEELLSSCLPESVKGQQHS